MLDGTDVGRRRAYPRLPRPVREIRDKAAAKLRVTVSRLPTAAQAKRKARKVLRRAAEGELPVLEHMLAVRLDLRWAPEFTQQYGISSDGKVATRTAGLDPWAAGLLLPTSGCLSFVMHVERLHVAGRCCVGVCDAEARVAWGLHVQSGRLLRWTRDGNGKVCSVGAGEGADWPERGNGMIVTPPTGTHAVAAVDAGSTSITPLEGSEALLIEVLLDPACGSLGFRVNGGAPRPALRGLPCAAMRPWARLMHTDDQVRLEASAGLMRAILPNSPASAALSTSCLDHRIRTKVAPHRV